MALRRRANADTTSWRSVESNVGQSDTSSARLRFMSPLAKPPNSNSTEPILPISTGRFFYSGITSVQSDNALVERERTRHLERTPPRTFVRGRPAHFDTVELLEYHSSLVALAVSASRYFAPSSQRMPPTTMNAVMMTNAVCRSARSATAPISVGEIASPSR